MSGLSGQCQRYRERLPEYVEGRLSGDARAAVEQHVAGCARCAQEVTDLRAVIAAVREIPPEAPPEQLTSNVLRAVARHAAAQPRRAARPFWSRVAIPASAAVGLLAVALGYRLMEQGYTPKSMSAMRVPTGSVERARETTSSPAAAVPRVAGTGTPESAKADRGASPPQEAAPAVEAPRVKGAVEQKPRPTQPVPRPGGGSPAVGFSDQAASKPAAREGRDFAALDHSGGRAGGARADSDQAASGVRKPSAPLAPAPPAKADRERTRTEVGARRKESASAKASGGGGAMGRGGEYRGPGPNRSRAQVERGAAPAPAPLGAAAEMQAPQPASARAVLTRQGDQLALAVQLAAGPGEKVEVKAGEQSLWSGAPVGDERVVISLEGKDGGPKRIPITVSSPTGTRNYTLFAPPFAQLGQQSGTLVRRYRGTPLATVFAEMSAKAGLVLLVEGSLEREMNGELNLEFPKAAVETLAKYGGYEVSTEDLVVYTLRVK